MQQVITKEQLWEKLDLLNPRQQQNVLAFIDSLLNAQRTVDKQDKQQLLTLSVWTEEDILPILEAQERMNAWQIPSF